MFVVNNYTLAVVFCFVTMLCWGSWGNTQKLASKSWRYELFYWDYVIGMLLFSILSGFTLGSFGSEGRSFVADLAQADWGGIGSVLLGGVVFNASNILLSASVSLAGLAVAFPLGVGLALVLGVIVNYVGAPKGDPVIFSRRCAHRRCHCAQRNGLGPPVGRREEQQPQGALRWPPSPASSWLSFTVLSRPPWISIISPILHPA